MRKIIPLVLGLAGLGAGVAAGVAVKPAPEAPPAACGESAGGERKTAPLPAPAAVDHDYIRINNQFVVPVVEDGRIKSLVVMSLSLEVRKAAGEQVYAREPKLRDAFLRVMFDHANSGGFDGAFTSNGNLAHLRAALREAGTGVLGPVLSDVLIIDIARQDN